MRCFSSSSAILALTCRLILFVQNSLFKRTFRYLLSFLTNRSQSVCVNGIVSEPQKIDFGVPQGSTLGPLLFIMYINDISHVIRYSNVEQYADDTLLYFASDDVNIIESNLSSDLDGVTQWLSANYLIFNSSKSR